MSAEEEGALLALLAAPMAMQNKAAAAVSPVCSVCGAALPSTHLLSLHVAEVHDSFFAAQVARKLKVRGAPLGDCAVMLCTTSRRCRQERVEPSDSKQAPLPPADIPLWWQQGGVGCMARTWELLAAAGSLHADTSSTMGVKGGLVPAFRVPGVPVSAGDL